MAQYLSDKKIIDTEKILFCKDDAEFNLLRYSIKTLYKDGVGEYLYIPERLDINHFQYRKVYTWNNTAHSNFEKSHPELNP